MAVLKRPRLLLLDEHTAALDPKTGERVLELTTRLVAAHRLTTMMVTNNLEQSLKVGNRTIMMDEGRIILDLHGSERRRARVSDLSQLFEQASGRALATDSLLLARS